MKKIRIEYNNNGKIVEEELEEENILKTTHNKRYTIKMRISTSDDVIARRKIKI